MRVVERYPDGIFNWIDLATTDPEGAKAFYGTLFGWEAVDQPVDTGGTYTMFRIAGKDVAGGGQMDPQMAAQGAPAYWTSYVKHDDADGIALRAQKAGGVVVAGPFDVMTEGRMAIIQDPTGAIFGVWQPRNHIGAQLVNIPNALVWTELQTRDDEGALAFYKEVFDWESVMEFAGETSPPPGA